MKKTKKKNYVLIALIVLLLAISIGYAAFSATLTINGSAEGKGTWDVKFTSAKVINAAGDTITDHGTAEVTDDNTVTATIELAAPGDGVMIETVITNSGSIPAVLTSFEVTDESGNVVSGANNNGLIITLPTNGPAEEDKLAANGGTCKSQFGIKWDENTDTLDKKTFTISFTYEQDTEPVELTPDHSDSGNQN